MTVRVLVTDLGSKMNRFGGEARIAGELYHGLKGRFSTYYLGYETAFIGAGMNAKIVGRERMVATSMMHTGLAENRIMRLGYYFLSGRLMNIGIGRGELRGFAESVRPDVVIANSVADFPVLRYLRKRGLRFKAVYVDHASLSTNEIRGFFSVADAPLTFGSGMLALSTLRAKRAFFRFFDAVVAISKSQQQAMERFTDRVHYIPNGLDVAVSRDAAAERELMRRHGLRSGNFIILYVGRMFDRQKNVSTLIKAFMGLRSRRARLLLVGDGPSIGYYKRLAGADRRIVFAGSAREGELTHYYSMASLFVLPSVWEGFNLTMIEASAHGLPILLSRSAYISDIRGRGVRIPSFRTLDHSSLERELRRLMGSRSALERARAASSTIARRFTRKKMLAGYTALIEKLAGRT